MSFETDIFELEDTSPSLLRNVQIRDEQAWVQFFEIYRPAIHSWCRKAGLQDADAADAVQEVFKALAGSFELFERQGIGSFRAWLKVVTRNKISDFFRRSAKQPQAAGGNCAQLSFSLIPDPMLLPDKTPEDVRQNQTLQRALEALRAEIQDRTWDIFWRTTVEGHDAMQVADDLNMKLGTVYQAKSRTLIRLRELLTDLTPAPQELNTDFP